MEQHASTTEFCIYRNRYACGSLCSAQRTCNIKEINKNSVWVKVRFGTTIGV